MPRSGIPSRFDATFGFVVRNSYVAGAPIGTRGNTKFANPHKSLGWVFAGLNFGAYSQVGRRSGSGVPVLPPRYATVPWRAFKALRVSSKRLGAVHEEPHRVERGRSADEQTIAHAPAEADVRHDFGHQHFADQRAIRVINVNAVARRGPDPAVLVDPKAVKESCRTVCKDFTATERPLICLLY